MNHDPDPRAAPDAAADRLLCMQVESLGVNGLALARGTGAIGFRGVALLPEVGRFDGKLVVSTLSELGPHDPADRYHHVAFRVPATAAAASRFLRQELIWGNGIVVPDFAPGEAATVHLEWTFDGVRALARFSADRPIDLLLIANGCLSAASVRCEGGGSVSLEQDGWRVYMTCPAGRAWVFAASLAQLESQVRGISSVATGTVATLAGLCVRLGPESPVCVAMAETAPGVPDPGTVATALQAGRTAMAPRLMASGGAAEHCADALQRLVGFAAAYDPASGRRFVPVNRDWAGPNAIPAVFMWDNFFDSYLACFHHPDLARESLAHITGIIRDRGMEGAPPQRNLIVPIVYSKAVRFIGDRAFASATFPAMMQFMRFWFGDRGDGHPWRDGNDDGLIECGSCWRAESGHEPGRIIQDAFDETGYDDSPMYSAGFAYERRAMPAEGVAFDFKRGTLNLTMVGQNALYVAACRALAAVARWLGDGESCLWLLGEAERVAGRVRERLLDPARGYYQNRFFNGEFSTVKTPDIFSPLLAGIADGAVAARLREVLLDPAQFWGGNVIPTVSRDDPAYRDDRRHGEYWRGNYWRGNVWGPTNYITYLAIRHAGWCDVAAEFSARSRRLFMADWLPRHHACENYPPEGGTERTELFTANGGRDPHYIWGALLAVLALEELFSVEDVCEGIRFGTTQAASFGSWDGFVFQGHRGRVSAGADGVFLDIPGVVCVRTDRPVAVREFVWDGGTVSFRYDAPEGAELVVEAAGCRWAEELPAGYGVTTRFP